MHDSPSSTMEIFQSSLLANNKCLDDDDDAGTVIASVQRIRSSSLRSSSSASLIVLVGMLLLVVEGCWSFVVQNQHQYQYNIEYENEKCKGGRRFSTVLSAVDVESTILGATMSSSNLKGREFVDQMIMKNSTESGANLEVIAQKAAGNDGESSGSSNIQSNENRSRSSKEHGEDVDEYSEESSSTAAAADVSDGSGSDGDDDDDDNNGGTPQRPTIADRTKFFRKRGLGQLQQKLTRSRQPGRSEAAKQKQESKTIKKTSVGERRVGSASRARQGGKRLSGGIMDVIRKTATGTGATKKQQESSSIPPPTTSPKKDNDTNDKSDAAATSSVVQSTIEEILEKQRSRIEQLSNKENQLFQQLHRAGASNGVNKYVGITSWDEQVLSGPLQPQKRVSTVPKPGTVLVKPSYNPRVRVVHHGQRVTVRVGTSLDDIDIANLRLSVFSDFTPQVRKQFCARSCKAIVKRRMQGATCLVATVPTRVHGAVTGTGAADGVDSSRSRNSNIIIGSAECSFHEFRGTELGRRRPADSILYVTEVAVSPNFRRCGIGAKLMKGIDKIAKLRKIETVFLHVDVSNHAAIALYERAGYRRVDSEFDPMFFHFTKSLNLHDGATKGRNHYLLCKDLVSDPTWNDVSALGFEIPK